MFKKILCWISSVIALLLIGFLIGFFSLEQYLGLPASLP
jgi:hypothetical protein